MSFFQASIRFSFFFCLQHLNLTVLNIVFFVPLEFIDDLGIVRFFFNRYGPIQVIYFSLCEFQHILYFKQLTHYNQVVRFVGTEFLITFFYYPFNVYSVCSDVLFTSDISTYVLSLVSLASSLLILLIFSETRFDFINFSLLMCCFLISLISVLSFTILFTAYLGFNLLFFFQFSKVESWITDFRPFFHFHMHSLLQFSL